MEFFIKLFEGALKKLIKERIQAALAALKVKDEKAYRTVLASLYPVVDVQLEDITDKTKTKADDVVVDGLKEGMEASAADNGVTLPNLDSD